MEFIITYGRAIAVIDGARRAEHRDSPVRRPYTPESPQMRGEPADMVTIPAPLCRCPPPGSEGGSVFVFGVHIESMDVFDRHCLPGIATFGGRDATLITTADLPKVKSCNDMLEAAAQLPGAEAIVLLPETTRITDPMFRVKVTRALAAGPGLDVFGPPAAEDPSRPGESLLILRSDVPTRLLFDEDTFDAEGAPAGHVDDLIRRAQEAGLRVGTVDIDTTPHTPRPAVRPNGMPDAQVDPDGFRSAALAWQGRAAHRITRALLERWREGNPTGTPTISSLPEADRAPAIDPGPGLGRVPVASDLTYERAELVNHVPADATRVLDVSCGNGLRGAAIKDRTGAHVTGIEAGQALADAARTRLDEVWQLDLNTADALPDPAEKFDTILLSGTIDRLVDPEATLRALLELLTPDGALIVTVPNVKHWSVVLPLLLEDRFEYSPTGPIRPSSLRFFTMIEAAVLLRRAGLAWCEATAV